MKTRVETALLMTVPVPWANFMRRLTPQQMASFRQQLPIDSLSPANGNTLNNILADPLSRKHLFPEEIMVRDDEMFYARENYTHMTTQRCSALLVSGSASSMYVSLSLGRGAACQIGCR